MPDPSNYDPITEEYIGPSSGLAATQAAGYGIGDNPFDNTLTDLINPQRGNVSQWFSGYKTGRPQTYEVENFILDYMSKFGVPPTVQMVNDWKQGQKTSDWHYTPESTMGRFGFERPFEYSGQSYGPHPGKDVPQGGLVITDPFGNPIQRTFNPKGEYPTQVSRGQYYTPPESYLSPYTEGFRAPEGTYPESTAFTAPEMPSPEEGLKAFSPQQVYAARLDDFIDAQVTRDAPKVAELNQQHSLGQLTDAEYVQQIEGLWTNNRANEIVSQAQAGISQGMMPEQLPYYMDAQNTIGDTTRALMSQGVEQLISQQKQSPQQPPTYGGEYVEAPYPPVDPWTAFDQYVANFPAAESAKQWLYQNRERLIRSWNRQGDFIQWLNQFLRGGQ